MSKKRLPYKEKNQMNFLDIPCNFILLMDIFSLCNKSKEGRGHQKEIDHPNLNSKIQELEKRKLIKRIRVTRLGEVKKGRGGVPYLIETERLLSEEIFNNLTEFSIWRSKHYLFFPLTYNARDLKERFDLDSFFEEWLSYAFLEYYKVNEKHIKDTFRKDETEHHFGGLIEGFIFNFLLNEGESDKIKRVKLQLQIKESCDKCENIIFPTISEERKKIFLNLCKKYVGYKLKEMKQYELAISGDIINIKQILKGSKEKKPLTPLPRFVKEVLGGVKEQFQKQFQITQEISELQDKIKKISFPKRNIFRGLRLDQLEQERKDKVDDLMGLIPLNFYDTIMAENKKRKTQ